MKEGQVLKVTEYLKPGAEEIAAMLPQKLGERMMRRIESGGWFPFVGRGVYLNSTGVFGFYILRATATLKHIRKHSLRYHQEQKSIETWLEAMESSLSTSPSFAAALAELPRVLKGYSDTLLRGQRAFAMIMTEVVGPAVGQGLQDAAAGRLKEAIEAALADPEHVSLNATIGHANPNSGPGSGSPTSVNVLPPVLHESTRAS